MKQQKIKIPNIVWYNYGKGYIDSLLKSGDITYEERNNILHDLAKKFNVESENQGLKNELAKIL